MTAFGSKALLVLVAAATLTVASPVSAFVAFECTAKNSNGQKFTNEHFGFFSYDAKISATSYALAACKAKSAKPDSCKITVCTKTHA